MGSSFNVIAISGNYNRIMDQYIKSFIGKVDLLDFVIFEKTLQRKVGISFSVIKNCTFVTN